ncbi:CATRA system-associated protein [Kitasatospora purpeofusca]|uniref:CATRA system-associated protein n=1 Tax=Kitasatospora purpeofusca TaxID=67352 RepID=UPI0036D3163D
MALSERDHQRVRVALARVTAWDGSGEQWDLVRGRLEVLAEAVALGDARKATAATAAVERVLEVRGVHPIDRGEPRQDPQAVPEPVRELVHAIGLRLPQTQSGPQEPGGNSDEGGARGRG